MAGRRPDRRRCDARRRLAPAVTTPQRASRASPSARWSNAGCSPPGEMLPRQRPAHGAVRADGTLIASESAGRSTRSGGAGGGAVLQRLDLLALPARRGAGADRHLPPAAAGRDGRRGALRNPVQRPLPDACAPPRRAKTCTTHAQPMHNPCTTHAREACEFGLRAGLAGGEGRKTNPGQLFQAISHKREERAPCGPTPQRQGSELFADGDVEEIPTVPRLRPGPS